MTLRQGEGRALSRLEKLLFRLESQVAVLREVTRETASRTGVIFELGLGSGRTYDFLRTHLAGREIFVFDRYAECPAEFMPPERHLVLGDIERTLPTMAARYAGQVVLAHSDVGSFDRDVNSWMAGVVSRELGPALAPDALVVADLPLLVPGTIPLPLPTGAREGRYFLYRKTGA